MKIKFKNTVTGEVVEIDLWDQDKFNEYMTREDYLLIV